MRRRQFISSLLAGIGLGWLGGCSNQPQAPDGPVFLHGVASGDPLQDRVILWTRVSGVSADNVVVTWRVATDAALTNIVSSGSTQTGPDADYTVKIDADGLDPGVTYFYQFQLGEVLSATGQTLTLPAGDIDHFALAVVGCSNYPAGYFNAYRDIARRDDIDLVLHLGDYIYEYGQGGYATQNAAALDRVPEPRHEVVSLDDYRQRHAQYKTDIDSQAMHARHPMIAVWDDHEITNDAWRDGAENHDADEGDWARRCAAAVQAYFEWMPIRGTARGRDTRIYRDFRIGNLGALIMLDTRLIGRDQQPQISGEMSGEDVMRTLANTDRRMLGSEQENWLRATLQDSADTTWQLLGQQVLVSPVRAPDLEPLIDIDGPSAVSKELLQRNIALSKQNPPLLLDTWDGYAAAREQLLGELDALAPNPVFLSGDLHTSIAGNLVPRDAEHPVAVEFMTGSVTSPGFAEYLPERRAGAVRDATLALNTNLKYMETDRRGWLSIQLTPRHCVGEWHLLDTISDRSFTSTLDQRLVVTAGEIAQGLIERS